MENPLLHQGQLPTFTHIIPEQHVLPAITEIIDENRKKLKQLLAQPTFTWENLMDPMEDMSDKLAKAWSPISHMHGVLETEELRAAYNACLPILTEYHTQIMQNADLFAAISTLAKEDYYQTLSPSQKKVIDNDLRDFKLAGVNLPESDKAQFAKLQQALSKCTTQFAENILDATNAWTYNVTDENDLQGLTEPDIQMAKYTAEKRGLDGWLFTLEYPSYLAVMKYLDNRELRKKVYEAFTTRASDQGPNAGKFDNTKVMDEILRLRYELARLLGFANYAEYSLTIKMADSPKRVLNFLNNLVDKSIHAAEKDMQELLAFAKQRDGIEKLEAWDITYYSEKLLNEKYSISQEELKPYFPAPKVLQGMFSVVNKLYGITIVEKSDVDVWQKDVKFYEVYDANKTLRGYFYTDLYARPHKRDGAWMDECRMRRRLLDGTLQLPVAFLTCNFTPPLNDQPVLLNQDEVETLFHEFGHCLHHMLTLIDYGAISGINGVPWDAVEFPSQLMERWCWEKETIPLISGHYETGEVLPDEMYNKLMAAKNFHSGMQMLRQLEFALFDFRIHLEYDPTKGARIAEILKDVRAKISVVPYPAFNRFQNSFSHIFAGSYAAGYYSYKWAEVLSSDAYSLFEETGAFNPDTGKLFMQNILEVGGLRDPMQSFIAFRGREPNIDALLRHSGLN